MSEYFFCLCVHIEGVAERLLHGSDGLSDVGLSPHAAGASLLVTAEWPKNMRLLPITLPRADSLCKWVHGSSMTLELWSVFLKN